MYVCLFDAYQFKYNGTKELLKYETCHKMLLKSMSTAHKIKDLPGSQSQNNEYEKSINSGFQITNHRPLCKMICP